MRLLPGFSLPVLLALLLIGTTPTGTGAGLHQFDLIHPLYSHVHLVNGQMLSHDQVPRSASTGPATNSSSGPALGAGSGANQTSLGLGISPVLPVHAMGFVSGLRSPRPALTVQPLAGRMHDTPPDPPPTSAA
jgi:hypothetical protein